MFILPGASSPEEKNVVDSSVRPIAGTMGMDKLGVKGHKIEREVPLGRLGSTGQSLHSPDRIKYENSHLQEMDISRYRQCRRIFILSSVRLDYRVHPRMFLSYPWPRSSGEKKISKANSKNRWLTVVKIISERRCSHTLKVCSTRRASRVLSSHDCNINS